jgi:hypothetical protein
MRSKMILWVVLALVVVGAAAAVALWPAGPPANEADTADPHF